MPTDAQVYSADELASLLDVDRKTVYVGVRLGQIPHRSLGRRILFPKVAIDAWLAEAANFAPAAALPAAAGFGKSRGASRSKRVLRSSGAERPHRRK